MASPLKLKLQQRCAAGQSGLLIAVVISSWSRLWLSYDSCCGWYSPKRPLESFQGRWGKVAGNSDQLAPPFQHKQTWLSKDCWNVEYGQCHQFPQKGHIPILLWVGAEQNDILNRWKLRLNKSWSSSGEGDKPNIPQSCRDNQSLLKDVFEKTQLQWWGALQRSKPRCNMIKKDIVCTYAPIKHGWLAKKWNFNRIQDWNGSQGDEWNWMNYGVQPLVFPACDANQAPQLGTLQWHIYGPWLWDIAWAAGNHNNCRPFLEENDPSGPKRLKAMCPTFGRCRSLSLRFAILIAFHKDTSLEFWVLNIVMKKTQAQEKFPDINWLFETKPVSK